MKLVLVFVILSALAYTTLSAPADGCDGFRITSPTASGLVWTEGQCYSVSYDFGASSVTSVHEVDLYTSGGAFTKTQWSGSLGPGTIDTGLFNVEANHVSGDYHFVLKAKTSSGTECEFPSVNFHVDFNPNSPPAHC
ncbi:9981_t:CDS:1 [Paraglomus occultum]|uniref:9981_t:CDS:1 n=1 Tax=Paraglomus occultum TaxID=144539 RepID=A0A9N9FUU0_9GLOM|nr:9981_t:CDS:1 [Paraglomus occultum]